MAVSRDRFLSLRRRRHLAEAALYLVLVVALAVAVGSGLPLPALAAAVVVAVAWEAVASGRLRTAVVDDLAHVEHPVAASVRETVADLAARMGISEPRVAVVDVPWAGVTVLRDDGPRLVVSREAIEDLDRAALRGVVAHELAHLSLGHLDRLDLRSPVGHLVGLSAAWVLLLEPLEPRFAFLGGGLYLAAGVYRRHGPMALLYLLGSGGVVLVPMALSAYADRCEELAADDVAVEHAGPRAYASGLVHVTTMGQRAVGGVGGVGSVDGVGGVGDDEGTATLPIEDRRGPLARLTARHPSLADRLERLDIEDPPPASGTDS